MNPLLTGGIIAIVLLVGGFFVLNDGIGPVGDGSLPKVPQPIRAQDETNQPHTDENGVEHTDETGPSNTSEIEQGGSVGTVDVTGSVQLYTGSYGNANITTDGTYRYITSDGLPNHETGTFPNSGNPNSISAQSHSYRVVLNHSYTSAAVDAPLPGVALNGIPLEPGTAERYQNTSWAIEAFDANGRGGLGIDWSNAHVQPNGTYHYHATPEGLLESALKDQSGDLIQLAWALDGAPIYYSQSNAYQSSWRVKSGTRPDGPGGTYDGTYTQDFEYISGLGDLDECNGTFIGGTYVYLLTDSFPYIQRCVHGVQDSSFERFGGGQGPTGGQQQTGGGQQPGTPPQEAITACSGKTSGASCTFNPPQGSVSGTCQTPPGTSTLACVP